MCTIHSKGLSTASKDKMNYVYENVKAESVSICFDVYRDSRRQPWTSIVREPCLWSEDWIDNRLHHWSVLEQGTKRLTVLHVCFNVIFVIMLDPKYFFKHDPLIRINLPLISTTNFIQHVTVDLTNSDRVSNAVPHNTDIQYITYNTYIV